MKFLHLADLHFGKMLHNLSLIESGDQPFWVERILEYIDEQRPDAVVIAGDVYDRGIPSRDAVPLLNHLLTEISRKRIPTLVTAGNHDGGERLEFLSEVLKGQDVYIAGTVREKMTRLTRDFGDGFGPVTFWLMPYLFPASVRDALGLGEDAAGSYTDAARALLERQEIDFSRRNVLIAHQTVLYNGSEPEHSLSETSVGGVGGIDASAFEGFDYVALGHIHGAQKVGRDSVRYAGSPLCYHFSEAGQRKGPLMVTLNAKEQAPLINTAKLEPLHRVRPTMAGELSEILARESASAARDEYVRVVLTDEWVAPDTHERLRALFESHGCQLLDIAREPKRGAAAADGKETEAFAEDLTLEEHFLRFYRRQTGMEDPEPKDAALIRFAASQSSRDGEADEEALAEALAAYALRQEEEKA